MNITQQATSSLEALLTLEIHPDDYAERVDKTLKSYARKAKMSGFREGKVPMSLIKKLYGKGAILDELNKTLQEELDQYLQREQVKILGYPIPVPKADLDFDLDTPLTYTFEFEIGLSPQVSLNLQNYDLVEYEIEVDEPYLEKEIRMIRNRFGKLTNPEESAAGDSLFGTITEVDANGNPVDKGLVHKITLNPEMFDYPSAKEILVGKKTGEEFSFNPAKFMSGDKKRGWLLNVDPDEYSDKYKDKSFIFSVEKVNHYESSEFDENLFKQVYPTNTPENVNEFKDKLKISIQEYINKDADKQLMFALKRNLLEHNRVDLPDSFLKKWLAQQPENKLTTEEIEVAYESYAKGLRYALLRDELIRTYPDTQATEEDVKASAVEMLRASMGDLPEEQLENLLGYYLNNKEMVNKLWEEVQEKKLFDFLKSVIVPATVHISATDFERM